MDVLCPNTDVSPVDTPVTIEVGARIEPGIAGLEPQKRLDDVKVLQIDSAVAVHVTLQHVDSEYRLPAGQAVATGHLGVGWIGDLPVERITRQVGDGVI